MNVHQKGILVNLVSKCFKRGVSVDWKQISQEANQLGPPIKDALGWKKAFEHAKSKAKTKSSEKSDLDRQLASLGKTNLVLHLIRRID